MFKIQKINSPFKINNLIYLESNNAYQRTQDN